MVRKAMDEIIAQTGEPVVPEKTIKEYIHANFENVNPATVSNQIMFCTVNRQSRVNDPKNQRSILCNRDFDFLFRPVISKPEVVLYNREEHGQWEICRSEDLKFYVKKVDNEFLDEPVLYIGSNNITESNSDFTFALESHLRDFIANNLSSIGNLTLCENGVEYATDVGRIDVLAQNENSEFVVIELKLSRGEDAALGQIQRYMGWVKENLAESGIVHGVIVAKSISKKLKYAVSVANHISLFEYSMQFSVSSVSL